MAYAGFLAGFLLGLLVLPAAGVAALLCVARRLRRHQEGAATAANSTPRDGDQELPGEQPFPYKKRGSLWILEREKIPKVSNERLSSGGPDGPDTTTVEVLPAKKSAKIQGHSLSLSAPDGPDTTIELLNCTVVAVSASSMSSRKWTKSYPIKLESQESEIYNGSKVCFLYAETSWEKESWCKALRLAATADKKKLNWHAKLSKEFSHYISSLNSEYPCLLKLRAISAEDQMDGSSKVRVFLKKLAKKASTKVPVEGERKMLDKIRSYQGAPFIESLLGPQEDKFGSSSSQDTAIPSGPTAASSHTGQLPAFPDVNADDKVVDEGTLCWNLLSSRLFFDAQMSDQIIKAHIQRTLSSMRTPAYVGEITLTEFSLGKFPPYVQAMRVLPLDFNELLAFEVDFEYSGGILLHIETRLKVEEPELQKDLMKTKLGTNSNGDVDLELIESIEQYGNQFRGSRNSVSSVEETDEAGASTKLAKKASTKVPAEGKTSVASSTQDASQSKSTGWTSTYISWMKNMTHSIADYISQVPLSLAIKITSVRGTLRIHMKPPPSDQLWYGFTSMPDLEWDLESSVGDMKITNSRIASLIGNKIKVSLRDSLVTLVHPNCESISMPGMLAEKDDWVPDKDGPYIWLNHEPTKARSHVAATTPTHPEEAGDPRKPLLATEKLQADSSESTAGSPPYTSLRAIIPAGEQQQQQVVAAAAGSVGDDAKRKSERRSRMMDLGKKMGDKLEEKRRQVEERGRQLEEKMRENARTNSMERSAGS